MKTAVIVLYFLSSVLIAQTTTTNSSYCCSGTDELWEDSDGSKYCMDEGTKPPSKITINCFDNLTYLMSNDSLPYKLNSDGSLSIIAEMFQELLTLKPGEWDMDELASGRNAQGEMVDYMLDVGIFCVGHQTEDGVSVPLVLLCLDPEEPEMVSSDVMGYCMAVSAVFLTLTAAVYLAFPELRDLQGKSIVSLCGTQATANALFCVMKVMLYTDMTWCAIRGFLAYYFNISSFFWMNAIAIQILISMKCSSTSKTSWKKFGWYALYAWGTPAFLTAVLAVINYHPAAHNRPGIGYNNCWFLNIKHTWMYMYSVLAIVMAANTAIFVYSSVFLWKHTFSSGHLKALRYKSWMMFRLFIIMGLPWIFEMVTSLTPAHTVWVILDIINCLQGVVVFLILVVFRRRVIKVLSNRDLLCCLDGLAQKYLAGADDEEEIVTPAVEVHMEDTRPV